MSERGITMSAAKFILKGLVEKYKAGQDTSQLDLIDIVERDDLWAVDEWTHVGLCIQVCLENPKLISAYHKNPGKMLDPLIGKTIKLSNMTVQAELIKELMPMIIEIYFSKI